MNRRDFLAASVLAAASADAAPQLAVKGGAPVRSQPLAGPNWGPQYYDDKEQTQLTEALEGHNPFRFSNPPGKSKVAAFENDGIPGASRPFRQEADAIGAGRRSSSGLRPARPSLISGRIADRAGYSNGVMCYIASERMLCEGGYDVVDSMVYYGQPGPFAPGVENGVFQAIHQAMKKVGR